jgi:hypothetical protein
MGQDFAGTALAMASSIACCNYCKLLIECLSTTFLNDETKRNQEEYGRS